MNIKINTLVNSPTSQKTGVANKADKKTAETIANKQENLDNSIKISQKAKDISQTSQSVNKAKVAEIKQAILDGSYKVDTKEVAKNIFNFERMFEI